MTEQAIKDAIASLGESPKEIADNLEKLGIKGRTACPWDCIIANFLIDKFGLKDKELSVTQGAVHFTTKNSECNGPAKTATFILHPTHVRAFILRFDLGEYPNLIQPLEENANVQNRTVHEVEGSSSPSPILPTGEDK